MTILGVHITKIKAEKNALKGAVKVGISNNISIKDAQEKDFSLGSAKQKGLRFVFSFICDYTPGIGSIELDGEVLFVGEEAQVNEILKSWKDKKQLPGEIMEPVLNSALTRCNIEALKLSQDINLPSPIPLPKIERKTTATITPKAKAK